MQTEQVAAERSNGMRSQQVLEWQEQAQVKTKAEDVLTALRERFSPPVPVQVERAIQGSRDLAQLDRWFRVALTASSLDEFQQLTQLKSKNGGRRKRIKANGTDT